MTNRSKESIRDWIIIRDSLYPFKKLNKKKKKERMLYIKSFIQLCNDFERDNVYDKISTLFINNTTFKFKK